MPPGPAPMMDAAGHSCPVMKFAEEHTDPVTGEMLPGVLFRMAIGDRIDLNLIKDLLEYRRDAQGRFTQLPRLYVTENCGQLIWALENYTGRSKGEGACKDFIDCLRYAVGSELRHVDGSGFSSVRPGVEEEGE